MKGMYEFVVCYIIQGYKMKVVIIDDDPLVCMSIKTILQADSAIEVVGTGNNGYEAIKLYRLHQPDILLMDIRMEGMNGVEAAEKILTSYPDARILFLTTFTDDDYIIKALKMGVKGFILKQHFDSIVSSIKTVFFGQRVFGDEIITKLPSLLNDDATNDFSRYDLSERESQIIRYVAEGLSNKEISNTLFLSEGTVRNYISIILEKLELRDRTQIAVFYYKNK